jgi:radical SAM superfamily enzyme YgiQ (UPF0313 family)
MRLLLIEALGNTVQEVERRYPPLQLAYLAAYAKVNLPVDVRIARGNSSEVTQVVASFNPDVVGMTCVTQNFAVALDIAKSIKAIKPIPVLMGGHHVSSLPESMSEHMDAAIAGEGEQTFAEVLSYLSTHTLSLTDIIKIPGIAIRNPDGTVQWSSPRSNIKNLDDIPLPDRKLLTLKKDDVHMFSSRGCPYKCSFCSSSHFWKSIRYHSEERVANEIIDLVLSYGVTSINLYDDLFASKKIRLKGISDRLDANKKFCAKRPRFACLARADSLSPDILSILKHMGVAGIALGFESGSNKILKAIKGPQASVDANLRAVAMIHAAGIPVVGSVIVGVPGETLQDAQETLGMLPKLGLCTGEAYLATPYPGTQFWDYAIQQGKVSHQMNWQQLSLDFNLGKDHPIIINEQMSRDDIYNYYLSANKLMHG